MAELLVTPHYLAFRLDGRKTEFVWLDAHISLVVRSLREEEKKFFREQEVFDLAQRRGIVGQGNYSWNGEAAAHELGFYVFMGEKNEQLGAIVYDDIVVPYQRVVELESMIENEVVRDEYVCDIRREIAGLKLPGVSAQLYSSEGCDFYEGMRLFMSAEYDLKVNVRVLEKLIEN